MSFQPPVSPTPVHGFDPPNALSFAAGSSQIYAPASVTGFSLVSSNGIGRNAITSRTWAEAERLGLVTTTYGSRLGMAVSASRRY